MKIDYTEKQTQKKLRKEIRDAFYISNKSSQENTLKILDLINELVNFIKENRKND